MSDPVSLLRADERPVGWAVSEGLVDYPAAVAAMEARAEAIGRGEAEELVWLLEHPPLYTAGVSARSADLLQPGRLPVFESGRGGQYTYHGPGQRVAYAMLDLRERGRDVRAFVAGLEGWIIAALAELGVEARVSPGRVGVWVGEEKIAAIGVRVRRWVSFHGVAINVAPDLGNFSGIVPCGIADAGVTSLSALGAQAGMGRLDQALARAFPHRFGPTLTVPAPI